MCKLSKSQQSDNQELISLTFSQKIIELIRLGSIFYQAQTDQFLPSDEHQRRQ